ncbi:ABC transporter substrate-binding protein [bacterium]|nr:ABC transporter substrate-binding protein [bacterium]
MMQKSLMKVILNVAILMGFAVTGYALQGVSDDEVVLGTHTALSGPVAGWGSSVTQAVRMRFDEVNAAGGIHGRQIKYVVEDSQYSVPVAVQKANKLINRDKVFALIASIGTPHNLAVFKMQLPKDIPSLFPYTAARAMVQPLHPLKFSAISSYYDQGRAGLKYFVEEKGKKNVCMLYVDTDFGAETVDAVNDQLKAMNMNLVAETSHKDSETNFVGAITKLRKANCDLIMLGTIIRDTIMSVATARKMGWDVTMVGNTAACNSIVSGNGGKAVEGLYAVTGIEQAYYDQVSGKGKQFFDDYNAKFGSYPGGEAQVGYIVADLTVLALQNAGKDLTTESFIKGMEAISSHESPFNGPTRSFSADKHEGSRESMLLQIQDGRWLSPTGKKMILKY